MSEQYAPYFAVALASLADHASPERTYDVIVLHEGLSEDMQCRLQAIVARYTHIRLRFVQPPAAIVDKLRDAEKKSTNWPRLVFYRLFLGEMFPEYDKMIFLGVDIVVRSDLAELYDVDLQGAPLAAVPDSYFLGKPEELDCMYRQQGEEAPRTYCNSDVQLQNLELYRQRGIGEAILKSVRDHNFPLIEQDAMNLVLRDEWKTLPIEWNFWLPLTRHFSLTAEEYARIPEEIRTRSDEIERARSWKIVHYPGVKPWNLALEESPLTELWWQTALAVPDFGLFFARALAEQRKALKKDWRKQRLLSLLSLPRVRRKREAKSRRLSRVLAFVDKLQQLVDGRSVSRNEAELP